MFGVFSEALTLAMDVSKWPQSDRPVIAEEYPKQRAGKNGFDTSFDVIVLHVVLSEPGNGARKPLGVSNVRITPHPTKARYKQIETFWEEMVTVQFSVYAKSNRRANELVNWLHRTLMMYANALRFFQSHGMQVFSFVQRLEDKKTAEYGNDLYFRGMQYRFKLQMIDVSEAKTLETVGITVDESGPVEISL